METNPFYTTSVIPAPFFCDREQETESIIRILTNGNNLVLKGPRRLGKSGLIQRRALGAIAKEWRVADLTSSAFISKYRLSSASSVQSATRALIKKKLVVRERSTYFLPDKYLALWLKANY